MCLLFRDTSAVYWYDFTIGYVDITHSDTTNPIDKVSYENVLMLV